MRYIAEYNGERMVVIPEMPQATAKEIGQQLHKIGKQYRGESHKVIGSYMGLNLTVRSEYNLSMTFDRNAFFVEGKSGLKYRCGVSGALPMGYVESAAYPAATLEKLPGMTDKQQDRIARLTAEQPALQEIVARKWNKSDELAALKDECMALQQCIDEALKEAEKGNADQRQNEMPQSDNTSGLQYVA